MISDVDPADDVCSVPKDQGSMTGKNIGDLLNDGGITWGGFMGGFDLSRTNPNGTSNCSRTTYSDVVRANILDYLPHHNWFQVPSIDRQPEASPAQFPGGDRLQL